MDRLLIGVPVFGQHVYTHKLVEDLDREGADYVVVDNRGDYPRLHTERVIVPGRNLGWAGGSNLIFRVAFTEGYTHAMTLNNDTRISKGFVSAILDPQLPKDAGLITPVYDDRRANKYLEVPYEGPAAEYRPVDRYRRLPMTDGTALAIKCESWLETGGFDERSFGQFSWGADVDLSLRTLRTGRGIYATERAFINHLGRKTATSGAFGRGYHARAAWGMWRGMQTVWGPRWQRFLDPLQVVDFQT
ncbi:glycosyltransferase family protein [Mycolicibacterium stellerae]|uniref:glycosyltransferase family 2 protein n=1 Tax=Mycolicibacterium stellerae TaxID=2358193 RepID=UPI001F3AE901|nr:glycosyltransferase family 2 protein [Mycolicibacterium stellerae]